MLLHIFAVLVQQNSMQSVAAVYFFFVNSLTLFFYILVFCVVTTYIVYLHGCPLKYTCNYNFVQFFFQAWLAIWMKLGQGNGSNMEKETQFLSIRKIWRIKAPVIDANMTNTSSKIRKYLFVFKIVMDGVNLFIRTQSFLLLLL